MKTTAFNKLAKVRMNKCLNTLKSKGSGYVEDADNRFSSFHDAARIKDESPFQALKGMEVKHTVSVINCVHRMSTDPNFVPTKEWVDEKIGDSLNYLLLLEGLIEERREELHETLDV